MRQLPPLIPASFALLVLVLEQVVPSDAILTAQRNNRSRADKQVYRRRRNAPASGNTSSTAPPRRRRRTRTTSASDHLVTERLTLLDETLPTSHYAGYVQIPPSVAPVGAAEETDDRDEEDGERNLFYWLFAPGNTSARVDDDDVPLVIWLNGGPGYSSLAGLFLENGPFRLSQSNDAKWMVRLNEHSWHRAPAWTLYVDQPVGTGLSFVRNGTDEDLCKDYDCIASDFYSFLAEFLWMHRDSMLVEASSGDDDSDSGPRYVLRRDFYIAGESFAGHFIPLIADRILRNNAELKRGGRDLREGMADGSDDTIPPILMPLTGIAIGNGYMSARTQWTDSDVLFGHGLISESQKAHIDQGVNECVRMMDAPEGSPDDIDPGIDECFEDIYDFECVPSKKGGFSVYDARVWLPHGQKYPPGRSELEAYFGGGDGPEAVGMSEDDALAVLRAIHATAFAEGESRSFRVSSNQIGKQLYDGNYDVIPVTEEVVRILSSGVRALFYNGVEDLMCDHISNERFLDRLPWDRRSDWITARRYAWIPLSVGQEDGRPSGFAKQLDNLAFLKVLDSGHLVPMDQPEVALAMLRIFMRGDKFKGAKQKIDQADPMEMNCNAEKGGEMADEVEDQITELSITSGSDAQKESPLLSHSDAQVHVSMRSYGIWALLSTVLMVLAFFAGRWSISRGHTREAAYANLSQKDRVEVLSGAEMHPTRTSSLT